MVEAIPFKAASVAVIIHPPTDSVSAPLVAALAVTASSPAAAACDSVFSCDGSSSAGRQFL